MSHSSPICVGFTPRQPCCMADAPRRQMYLSTCRTAFCVDNMTWNDHNTMLQHVHNKHQTSARTTGLLFAGEPCAIIGWVCMYAACYDPYIYF